MPQFPFEKMWGFQNVEHQIAMELSYFNWYQIVQELQKAFNAFASLLMKLLYATSEDSIKINNDTAKEVLGLYFGNGTGTTVIDKGLYALDVVQREFQGRYTILCRGYNEEITPASHHQKVMTLYQKMYPLVWELWHQIAEQTEVQGAGIPEEWLKDVQLPTGEEAEAEDQEMVHDGVMIKMETVEEVVTSSLGADET